MERRFALLAEALSAFALLEGLFVQQGALAPEGRMVLLVFALLAAPFGLLARNDRARPSDLGAGLFLVWLFAAAAFSPMPRLSLEMTTVLATGVLVFLASPALPGRLLSGVFLLLGAALAMTIYLEVASAARLVGSDAVFIQAGGRLGNPNLAGITLAVAAATALTRVSSGALKAAFLATLLPALALTGSRTAAIALVVGFAAFARRGRLRAWVLSAAAAALFTFALRGGAPLDPNSLTNLQRAHMFRAAVAALSDAPWTGHGVGTFPIVGVRFLSFPKWEMHLHDVVLDAAYALGAPGALAALGVWSAGLVSAFRRRNAPAAAVLASLVTDDLLWIPGFLVLAGWALRTPPDLSAPEIERKAHPAVRMGRAVVVAILAGVFLLYGGAFPAHSARAAGEAARASKEGDWLKAARLILPDRPGLVAARWALAARGGALTDPDFDLPEGLEEAAEDPGWLRQAALRAEAKGDTAEAVRLLEAALARDPMNVLGPHHLDLARLFALLGDTSQARLHLAAADEKMPRVALAFRAAHPSLNLPPPPVEMRPEALTADHHYRLAEPDTLASEDPMHFRYHRARAAEAFAAGDLEAAEAAMRRALFLSAREVGPDPATIRLWIEVQDARRAEGLAPEWTDEARAKWLTLSASAAPPRGPYGAAAARTYARPMPADGELAAWLGGPR